MSALGQTVTYSYEVSGGISPAALIVILAVAVFMIASMWRVFTKAGKPGWAAIIPIYNIIVLLEIVGRPIWWIVLFFIPFVNFVIMIIIYIDLATSFGKSGGFAVGLILLGIIFFPILAWGPATYRGPAAAVSGSATPPPPPPPAPAGGGFTA